MDFRLLLNNLLLILKVKEWDANLTEVPKQYLKFESFLHCWSFASLHCLQEVPFSNEVAMKRVSLSKRFWVVSSLIKKLGRSIKKHLKHAWNALPGVDRKGKLVALLAVIPPRHR